MATVEGFCDPAFAELRELFEHLLGTGLELGASVAVQLGDRVLVELWGGHRDPGRRQPWQRDTLVNVWSTGKSPVALCAHLLADQGLLDLDAPVARYWPEFAASGKEQLPVRYLLSHRAGLPGLREPTSVGDLLVWKLMTQRLAATQPWWEPGTASGYHMITFGYLIGEVIRRVSGGTTAGLLRSEFTRPLAADFHIGLPAKEDGRVATLVQPLPGPDPERAARFARLPPVALATLANPMPTGRLANRPDWRRAEIPAANAHATARGVAALFAVFAQGGAVGGRRYLSAGQVDLACRGEGPGVDLILGPSMGGREIEMGLGVWLSGPDHHYGPNERAVGHDGYGGSFGMADPALGLSIGYSTNLMGQHVIDDPRKAAIICSVYRAL